VSPEDLQFSIENLLYSVHTGIRTFQGHSVLFNGGDSAVGNDGLASLEDRGHADLFPLDGNLFND
jgi:hypothetical protein